MGFTLKSCKYFISIRIQSNSLQCNVFMYPVSASWFVFHQVHTYIFCFILSVSLSLCVFLLYGRNDNTHIHSHIDERKKNCWYYIFILLHQGFELIHSTAQWNFICLSKSAHLLRKDNRKKMVTTTNSWKK